jgi:hypothetical protein
MLRRFVSVERSIRIVRMQLLQHFDTPGSAESPGCICTYRQGDEEAWGPPYMHVTCRSIARNAVLSNV